MNRLRQIKPTLALVATASLTLFVTVRAAVVWGSPRPHLAVEGATVDIGRIPTSQPVQHRFVLSNSGTAELLVLEIKANCECTVAGLSRKVLQAGESMPLDVMAAGAGNGARSASKREPPDWPKGEPFSL